MDLRGRPSLESNSLAHLRRPGPAAPDEIAKAVNGTVYRDKAGAATDVSKLAFKAEFKDGKVHSVQIVNVGKTSLCSPN